MGKLGFVCTLLLGLGTLPVLGKNIFLFDFDATIVEERREFNGAFFTPFRLYRIEQRSTTLQKPAEGPRYIDVSPIEYQRIRKDLGTGQGKPGRFKKVTLQDGTQFVAGNYMIVNPDSYLFFGKFQDDEQNYLLRDQKEAEERTARGEGDFRGQMWPIMTYLLSQKTTSDDFGVITARGHQDAHWVKYFKHLRKQGYIKYLPNEKYIHNTSHPDYDRFSPEWNKTKQKRAVLEKTIRSLMRVPLKETDARLDPDGIDRSPFHTLVFADDDQDNLNAAIDLFREYLWTGRCLIKFIVVNTGFKTEIRESMRPQFAVMRMDGTFRNATMHEMLGEPEGISEEEAGRIVSGELSCEQAIAAQAKK